MAISIHLGLSNRCSVSFISMCLKCKLSYTEKFTFLSSFSQKPLLFVECGILKKMTLELIGFCGEHLAGNID